MRGAFSCTVVRAPFFADKRDEFLHDLAALTNTQVFNTSTGDDLRTINLSELAELKQLKVTKDTTTIVPKNTDKSKAEARIKSIKEQKLAANDFDIEQLNLRLSKLSGGLAVIYAGATTDIEQKELKLRIEDAINAVNAATAEGIVAGGGIAFLKCAKNLNNLIKSLKGDEKTGAQILLKSLYSPIIQITKNAELDSSEIINKILKKPNSNLGFDALNNKYCDMLECGIIDPTKVTKTALSNAVSVATTLLTTEVLITDDKG
ncbi:60 kda heat shock protein mitochondrial [Holotrichia oblita]|nr:60 kda heat shock protein mitochondrial [Holotrichia oblita]